MSNLAAIAGRNASASQDGGSFCLSDFDVLYAPLIATWVRSDQELTWLAPGTAPPLSASKVFAWGDQVGHSLLFWHVGQTSARPIGYAELNRMPKRPEQVWIGHFVLDPAYRGRGHGRRFVQALLQHAFHVMTASDVLLVVFPENTTAIRCYEKCGMVVTDRERKYFKSTRREHQFYRMEIKRLRFEQLAAEGEGPPDPIPFVKDAALLRSSSVVRRRAINQS